MNDSEAGPPPSRGFVMSGVMLAMLLGALDQTIVATAMPQVVRELHGLEHLSWVFTAYMLASTVTVPIYGKLSDLYGRRGFYLFGIGIFLVGSMLSGQARTMGQLIGFRAIQGIGGGAMMVNSISIIGDLFPPAERGRWQGLLGGVYGLASIAGPLLGGWFTDHLGWRWIFYINLPVGLPALAVIAMAMPRLKPDPSPRRIDFAGAATITAGLITLLLALVQGGSDHPWLSPRILGLFTASAVLLLMFGAAEFRARDPILPMSLFSRSAFSVSMLVTFLTGLGLFGAITFLPLFAQSVVNFSATNSGLVLAPLMVGLVVTSGIAGQIISRTGRYKALAVGGMLVNFIGMSLFTRLSVDTTPAVLVADMLILGAGLGTTFPIFTIVVQSAFDHGRLGVVTASTQLFRSIGGTVGIAVMGGVLNNSLSARLADIGSMPFVRLINRLNPEHPVQKVTMNTLQQFLSPAGQERIGTMIAERAPAASLAALQQSHLEFLLALKQAFAVSIGHVFFASAALMFVALLATLALPVIPLRRTRNLPVLEEIGKELEAEFVMAEPKDEPELD